MLEQRHIIVVDDDEDDRFMVATLFEELGVKNKIIFKIDGLEALTHFKDMKEPAALILCDINMPKLNGLELKKAINADPALIAKCTPFFYMTTTISQQTANEAFALGIQGFYVKESSFEGMREMLKNVIETSKHGLYPKDIKKFTSNVSIGKK